MHVEFAIHGIYVGAYSALGTTQKPFDLPARAPIQQQNEDFLLTFGYSMFCRKCMDKLFLGRLDIWRTRGFSLRQIGCARSNVTTNTVACHQYGWLSPVAVKLLLALAAKTGVSEYSGCAILENTSWKGGNASQLTAMPPA